MNDVDKLTLELFTSKNTYRKYLAKTDPETFQKQEMLQEKIMENKAEILGRIEEMLENSSGSSTGPSSSSSSAELREMFERFIFALVQEIESSKLRELNLEVDNPFLIEDYTEEAENEDEMFPVTKMSSSSISMDNENENEKRSFWSKDRVIKRDTYDEAILSHYPTNTEIRKRYVGKRMMP